MKQGLYFLSQLSDLDIDWLITAGRSEERAEGQMIMAKGEKAPGLFLVLEGEVRVFDPDTGEELALLSAGELLGEVSFLDRRGVSASVETLTQSKIFQVSIEKVQEKLDRDPIFAGHFYKMLAGFLSVRLREKTQKDAPPSPLLMDKEANEALAKARLGRLIHRLSASNIVQITGNDLTIEDIVKIAHKEVSSTISEEAAKRLRRSREVVKKLAESPTPIYGLNTGLGALKNKTISSQDVRHFQTNILRSHAVGVPPYYSDEVVRAIMLVRLNGMARGGAGVDPTVFNLLMDMLNLDVIPIVPKRGSVGMSDLAPLAHLSLALIGEGKVHYKGGAWPAEDALKDAGLKPVALGAKDALSLVSANSASIGHGALVLSRAINLLAHADIAAALSLEAFQGNPSPLDERMLAVRPHQGQVLTTMRLRSMLEGSERHDPHAAHRLQDPLSFRCVAQVHGACQEAMSVARRVIEVELNSTGDNPVVLPEFEEIVSNGNFHPAGVAMSFDMLALALSQICSISTSRTLRLNDPEMSGLPSQLTGKPGLNSGLGVLQKTITMLNSQARFLAGPASLDFMPIAGSIEDHSTMAAFVVSKAEELVDTAEYILAIELLTSAQAIDLRGRLRLGQGTKAAYDTLRSQVTFMEEDRVVAPDLEKVRGLITSNAIVHAVSEQTGKAFGI